MPLTKPMSLACVLALSACASPSSLQCPPAVDLRHAAPPRVEPLGLKPRMPNLTQRQQQILPTSPTMGTRESGSIDRYELMRKAMDRWTEQTLAGMGG